MNVRFIVANTLIMLGGMALGFTLNDFLRTTPVQKVKQEVNVDRYYCHETGFLMHHWELQKGNGNWIDTMERNRWEEPIKCEKP
jgi:hypothetical protein